MNKLRRFYNQNSKGIWTLAIIIAFFLILLKLVDFWVGKHFEEQRQNNQANSVNTTISTGDNINLNSNKSGVTGEEISKTKLSTDVEIIREFLDNCSEGKTEEAYEFLTQECKEEMYDSIEKFREYYCNNNFKEKNMNFNIENWVNNTYRVQMVDDIMATGKFEDGPVKQDYITLKKEDGKNKLNINNYIGRSVLNKEKSTNNINIKVINKNVYMDYETYDIEVRNDTDNDILLDTKENIKSMYIKDSKGTKYSSYSHEIALVDLYVQKKQKRNIKIKYYSSYNSGKDIKEMVFSKVNMNYKRENNLVDIEEFKEIKVNL